MENFPEIDVSDENYIMFQSEIGGINSYNDAADNSSWNMPAYSEANSYSACQPVYESVYSYDQTAETSTHSVAPQTSTDNQIYGNSNATNQIDDTVQGSINFDASDNQNASTSANISMAHCMVCDELVNLQRELPHPICQLRKPFKCDECNEEFNVESNRLVHTLTCHTAENDLAPSFICPICPNSKKKNYARFCGLKAHVKGHAKLDNFICKICQEEFQYFNMFNRHKRIFHAFDVQGRNEDDNSVVRTEENKPAELLYCAQCNCLISADDAKQHMKLHTVHRKITVEEERKKSKFVKKTQQITVKPMPNSPIVPNNSKKKYACSHCSKSFSRPAELKRHENIHNGEKYSCAKCGKKYSAESNLVRHLKSAHADAKSKKLNECSICGMNFTRETNLVRHIKKIHPLNGGSDHVCKDCPSSFQSYFALQKHVKSAHIESFKSNVVLYECDLCLRAFRFKSALRRHRQLHDIHIFTNKPYSCNRCDKRFTLRSSLKLHLDIHERKDIDDPVLTHPKCPVCMKHLSSENALRKHKKMHENRYECPQCFQKFPTIHKLDKHRCVPIASTDDQQMSSQLVELATNSAQNNYENQHNHQQQNRSATSQPQYQQLQKHFTCRICSMSFYSFRAYKEHNYQHQGLKPHLCWTCHKSFRTAELLSLHKEIHNREPIYCEYCPIVLHGRVEYLHHMRVAHQQYSNPGVQYVGLPIHEDRNLGSAQSFAEFTGRELTEHNTACNRLGERAHSAGGANDDNQHYFPAYDTSSLSLPHRCSVCLHMYDSAASLIAHWSAPVLDHSHSFAIVTCPLCPASLRGVTEAAVHVHSAHPYFNSDAASTSSRLVSTTSKPIKERNKQFQCETCSKRFGKRSDLKRHYLIHTGERPFKCPICEKAFRVKSSLKEHLRTHEPVRENGVEQPTCTICYKTFYSRSALVLHMRQHTGYEPLECRFCPTSFRTSNLRQIHEEKVHDVQKGNDTSIADNSTREERILSTVSDVSKNISTRVHKALQGRLAASRTQQLPQKQQLFPVKTISQNRPISHQFEPSPALSNPALSTLSQISRLPASTIQQSSSSAFNAISQQPHYNSTAIYILAKKITLNEYTVLISREPISPESIRDGIDTLSCIDEQSLHMYSQEKYCIRLPLHDSQMLNIHSQQLANTLQGNMQVTFRALPFNPSSAAAASLLPPPHTEFVKRCDICDVEFASREASEAHYASEDHETAQLMHPLTSNVEPTNTMSQFVAAASVPTRCDELSNFTCKLCGRKFLDMEPLVSHIRRDHERDHPNKFAPRPAARTAPIH